MAPSKNGLIPNALLAALPHKEYKRMLPGLEEVELAFGTNIYNSGDKIDHVYFLNSGIVSLLATVDGLTLDIGMIGSEGMIGLSLFLGAKTTIGQAIVQGNGSAMRMKAADFEKECGKNGALPVLLRRYARSMLAQLAHSAACYRFHAVDTRLARRLLMVSDRMRSDNLQTTHLTLAKMLGVRREAITIAAGSLRKAKLISHDRGKTSILNRPRLEAAACKCYAIIRDEELSFPVSN